jgi:D-threo-aldose 1-dehydrogenase
VATLAAQRLGRSGLRVTTLGLGTTALANMYAALPEADAQATLDAAFAAGVRYFDTAPAYGSGLAEQRLGSWLAANDRDAVVVSTKVGNALRPVGEAAAASLFPGALPAEPYMNFSRDAVLRSIDESLARLQTDRLDMVAIHDPDEAASIEPGADPYARSHFREAMDEAYPVLDDLRSQGVIGAVGVGMNGWEMLVDFAREGTFDYFLLAGRYTLLEQESARTLLPLCVEQGISVVVGGPYSSGILATGAVDGAHYNYGPAPPEVLERVRRLEASCAAHDVPLRAAALQFVAAHPAVASVVPGARTAGELRENVAMLEHAIPDALWAELRADDLIATHAPLPCDGRG